MTGPFEALVRARRLNAPWARINVIAFMVEMSQNMAEDGKPAEATLTVKHRPEVSSRRWWTITWVGDDGKRYEESAQELDLCMWRAVEREIQAEEAMKKES